MLAGLGNNSMSKKYPIYVHTKWLVALIFVEIAYVLMEFAFNAALLNAASGLVNDDQALHRIEIAGRILSGVGASLLAYWMYFRKKIPEESIKAGTFGLIKSMIICIPLMYFGQKLVVETLLVDGTSGFQRQYAESLILLKNGLQNGAVTLKNVPFDKNGITDPGDMAFLSVMGSVLMGVPEYANVLFKNEAAVMERLNWMASGDIANKTYPQYSQGSNDLMKGYQDYLTASRDYQVNVGSNQSKILSAWSDIDKETSYGYNRYLKGARYWRNLSNEQFKIKTGGWPKGIGSITEFRRDRTTIASINQKIYPKGLVLQYTWNGQKDDFIRLINEKGIVSWYEAMNSKGLSGLQPGLNFKGFEQSEAVQSLLKEKMGAMYSSGMRLGLSKDDFTTYVVMPKNEESVKQWVTNAKNRHVDLADGGQHEEEGRQFVRALIVPPIALGLSLFFSLLTLAKLPIRVISLKDKYEGNIPWVNRARKAIMVGDLVLIMSLPLARGDSKVMQSKLFEMMSNKAKDVFAFGDKGIIWLIKGEPLIYKTGQTLLEAAGLDERAEKYKSP